jgi:hypothetical protein
MTPATQTSAKAEREAPARPPIKSYAVTVVGFPSVNYSARSPGAARARAWRDYTSAYDVSFKRFLQISRVARIPHPAGVGLRVLVGGEPATTIIGYGQYIHFMRDDGDTALCSHPNDVASMPSGAA